jgi:hypothetical protein
MSYLIAVNGAGAEHTGSTIVGPVSGSVIAGANDSFITISGVVVCTEEATMEIPSHMFAPFLYHSHSYNTNTFPHDFVTVEGRKIATVGSSYADDQTDIISAGTNDFVTINP